MRALSWLLPLAACGEPHPCAGAAAPTDIESAVAHFADLPAPVDAACVVHSLARPLSVVASASVSSAQPAVGSEQPRIFIQSGPLTLALATAGDGAELLEFGEVYDDQRTRKAELVLPLSAPSVDDPFERVAHDTYGTTCAVCHDLQEDHPVRGTVSRAIRPESTTLLSISELADLPRDCGSVGCELMDALLSGPLVEGAFPDHWLTIRALNPQ